MSESLVIEAVRKTVTVDCTVEEAFRVFTSDAISWWPIATHSIHGDDVEEIVFEEREGGEVYELSATGEKGHWATVVGWEPPSKLVLAWNILEREAVATEVEIRFVPDGPRTRVELEHRGWEAVVEDAACKRSNYESGWERVLGVFADKTPASS
jgi:Activator of Hsp90 ATPase homolog 1-like protein